MSATKEVVARSRWIVVRLVPFSTHAFSTAIGSNGTNFSVWSSFATKSGQKGTGAWMRTHWNACTYAEAETAKRKSPSVAIIVAISSKNSSQRKKPVKLTNFALFAQTIDLTSGQSRHGRHFSSTRNRIGRMINEIENQKETIYTLRGFQPIQFLVEISLMTLLPEKRSRTIAKENMRYQFNSQFFLD